MSKFLELGKEVAEIAIERYKDSFFAYVEVGCIADTALESIGRKLYNNKEMFIDYQRFLFEEEDGFDWLSSEVNSYDFIYELVDEEINGLDSYYWSDEIEAYLPRLIIAEDAVEFLGNTELKEDCPVAIVLDEDRNDYIILMLTKKKYLDVEHCNKTINLKEFEIARVIDASELVDTVGSMINNYNKILNISKKWNDSELSSCIWEYVKNSEEFDSIKEYFVCKDENTLSGNYTALINTMVEKLQELKGDKEESEDFRNIKNSLVAYKEGIIEIIPENLFYRALDFSMNSVEIALKDKFIWSQKEHSWILVNMENKFKVELEERIKKQININSFDLPGVLPKDNEYEILLRFIRREIIPCIEDEYDESFGHVELENFWKEAERYIEVFLSQGNLKNLSKEDILHLYTEATDYKDEENMYRINIRLLRTYFIDVLVGRNLRGNKLDLIAIYYLIEKNIDKLSPYIKTMINNGFTFDELEHRISNLERVFIKSEVKKELNNIFKSWISNK